ncbi:MAG: hypothetical protein ACR2GS_08685 [Thermomicrobiales bacterium]
MDSSPGGTWPELPGFMRSPNIATDADLYEIENLAADPDRAVEQAMQHIASWEGKVVMDVGAGAAITSTGFTPLRLMSSPSNPIPPCASA